MTSTKLAFIDTETTGIARPDCGLIQIAGVLVTPNQDSEEFCFESKPFPDDRIEPGALDVSRNDKNSIAGFSSPIDVHAKFTNMLSRHVDRYDKSDKFWFVAYNADFDYQHVRSWFTKCNDKYFGSYFWNPPIDVMGLAAIHLITRRSTMQNFRLETVATTLGISVDPSKTHDALYDVKMTKAIFDFCIQSMGASSDLNK